MKDENCIFCRIADGDIPSSTIYEDELFRAILDLSPATRGHALIITKNHFENVFDLDETTASKLFVLAVKLSKAMKKAFKCDGLNIVQNNGGVAGQTVLHFHLHLIPRYEGDGQKILWNPGNCTDEDREKAAEEIRQNLNTK